MSDFDHEYLIKGAPRVLTKVAREIENFFSEYIDAERDCNFNPMVMNSDGTLSWSGSEESLMVDLDNALAGLTKGNAAKIWAYHGETGRDYIEGCLLLLEKGKNSEAGYWKADVGFNAGMAAIELEQSASVDAAMVLLKELESVCKRANRLAAVLAEMLLTALDRHPSLAANESIWKRIMAIKGPIEASDIMSEQAHNDDDLDPNRVRKLIAMLEAKQLAEGLAEPSGGACTPKAVRL